MSSLRRISAVLLSALALTLACAATSHAGDYTVTYCANGAPAERWGGYATAPGSAAIECASQGRMRITMNGSQYWNQGSAGVLTFDAPDGTSVVGWHPNMTYKVAKFGDDTDRMRVAIGPVPFRFDATTCINTLCPSAINGPVAVDPPAHTIEARVYCVDEVVGQSHCRFESELIDYGGTLTLRDEHPPTLRGQVDPALTRATTVATALRGSSTISVGVDDVGSGVWKTELRSGPTVLAQHVNGCVPQPTSSVVPCRTSQDATLDLDSTKLGDGAQTVAIVAVDASGNENVLWSGPVVVVNSEIGPGSPPELRGTPTGSDATDNARVTASWPVTAYRPPRACRRATYRKAHRVRCRPRPSKGTYRGAYAKGKTLTLTGRVSNTGTTDAITNAPVEVRANVLRGGLPAWTLTTRTDGTGRWRVAVPRDIGARRISVHYRSRENDVRDTARAEALLLVRSRTSLRSRPTKARAGRTVRFTGRVADGHDGVPIVLEAYSRGRYRPFATAATAGSGTFSVTYRLGKGFRGAYRFRARTQPTGTTPYPYVGAPSNTVTVRVRR